VISQRYHGEAHEGQSPQGLPTKRAHPLGRQKPRRGGASCRFRPRQEALTRRETSPEAEAPANRKRAAASERMYDSASENVPEGLNPTDVAGMRQGRQVAGG